MKKVMILASLMLLALLTAWACGKQKLPDTYLKASEIESYYVTYFPEGHTFYAGVVLHVSETALKRLEGYALSIEGKSIVEGEPIVYIGTRHRIDMVLLSPLSSKVGGIYTMSPMTDGIHLIVIGKDNFEALRPELPDVEVSHPE